MHPTNKQTGNTEIQKIQKEENTKKIQRYNKMPNYSTLVCSPPGTLPPTINAPDKQINRKYRNTKKWRKKHKNTKTYENTNKCLCLPIYSTIKQTHKQTEHERKKFCLRLFRSGLFGTLVLRHNKDWVEQTNKQSVLYWSWCRRRRRMRLVQVEVQQIATATSCLKVCWQTNKQTKNTKKYRNTG